MSNFGHAVKALNDVDVLYGALVSNEDYATVLQGRGLLAPDLPEPEPYGEQAEFGDEKVITGRGTSTVSLYIDDFQMSSDSARELALMLLAAANYAEKEQDNE